MHGADDGTRTRDPNLGKVMRYQLRYIRETYHTAAVKYVHLCCDGLCAILGSNQ